MSTTYRSKYTGEEIDALLRKEVQNISRVDPIHADPSELPVLDAAQNGTRYLALTNGALPLGIYDWWHNTQEWKLVDYVTGSTIYIDLNTGLTYRYRPFSPYLFPTSHTKVSQLENDSGYIPGSKKGAANGIAELDANGKVPSEQLSASTENWTFTLEDGTTVTKAVYVK